MCRPRTTSQRSVTTTADGFSLVELIVVLGVIALITAMSAPTLFSAMKANRLTAAGEELTNRLSLAQQMAVSRNHEIELRFYSYASAEAVASAPYYRATLLMKPVVDPAVKDARPEPLGDVQVISGGMIVADSEQLSPALHSSSRQSHTDSEGLIRSQTGGTASYKSIRFYPDGSCDLGTVPKKAYLTLVEESSLRSAAIPANFFAIQIDPYTSRITVFRP